ncbi:MAG: aldehyde ferredoxin oxidoreductase N-terminal domain-containing protein [Candidatus Bathyarchaeia archaeon]
MFAIMGKILSVDLSNGVLEELPTEDYARDYIGGRGIATRLYWENVKPETQSFDADNILVFMTGSLVGTGLPGANRMMIVGKSPLPHPEGFCYGNFGGFFPLELKRSGYDGIVIKGQSERPVYLWIENGKAELRDAEMLWGRFPSEVETILRRIHGPGLKFLTIGPAGENLVRSAVIVGSHRSSSAGGLGSVMGAKRLKAIAVRGNKKVKVANRNALLELIKFVNSVNKRLRLTIGPKIRLSGKADLIEILGNSHCPYCNFECVAAQCLYGKKLKGLRKCQSMEYYLPWLYSKESEPIETLFDAPTLANEYGICTFELEAIIEWIYNLHKIGLLTQGHCELPLSEIGTRKFLEALLHSISYREGLGEILAEGLHRAPRHLPSEYEDVLLKTACIPVSEHVGILARELIEARSYLINMLLYQIEPRRSRPILHHGFVLPAWHMHFLFPDISPIGPEELVKIADLFWGSEKAFDNSTYEGKGVAAARQQDIVYLNDSLGLCDWAWPFTYSLVTKDHIGDPTLEVKAVSFATGKNMEEVQELLHKAAQRTANLQRVILWREGWDFAKSDFPPEIHFSVPLTSHPLGGLGIAPGPDGKPIDMIGTVLEKQGYQRMVTDFYRYRGWSEKSGLPLAEKLLSLGQVDVLSEINKLR